MSRDAGITKSEVARRRREVHKENMRWPAHLVEVPRPWPPSPWPDGKLPIKIWRSRTLLVHLWNEPGGWLRLTVVRAAVGDDGDWRDGLTWDELQAAKRAVGYGDHDAVEIYPADKDVVNVANLRHLWISPEPLDFIWRDRAEEAT